MQAHKLINQPQILLIGDFDGVHIGHRALFSYAKNLQTATQLPIIALTFKPYAGEFFGKKYTKIQSYEQKIASLKQLDICSNIIELDFDATFASTSHTDFIKTLVNCQVKHVVLGYDFRFGYKRLGKNLDFASGNITVHDIGPRTFRGEIVSSSKIRYYLSVGKLSLANEMLGRPYTIGKDNIILLKDGYYQVKINHQTLNVWVQNGKLVLQKPFANATVHFIKEL